jgi:PIN domain nuclease of toxin-antitoxin system
MHHRDPFDRLLVAQARCDDLTIVTADKRLLPTTCDSSPRAVDPGFVT